MLEFGVSRGLRPSLGFEVYSKSSRVTNSKDSNPMGGWTQPELSNQYATKHSQTQRRHFAPAKYNNRSNAAQNAKESVVLRGEHLPDAWLLHHFPLGLNLLTGRRGSETAWHVAERGWGPHLEMGRLETDCLARFLSFPFLSLVMWRGWWRSWSSLAHAESAVYPGLSARVYMLRFWWQVQKVLLWVLRSIRCMISISLLHAWFVLICQDASKVCGCCPDLGVASAAVHTNTWATCMAHWRMYCQIVFQQVHTREQPTCPTCVFCPGRRAIVFEGAIKVPPPPVYPPWGSKWLREFGARSMFVKDGFEWLDCSYIVIVDLFFSGLPACSVQSDSLRLAHCWYRSQTEVYQVQTFHPGLAWLHVKKNREALGSDMSWHVLTCSD